MGCKQSQERPSPPSGSLNRSNLLRHEILVGQQILHRQWERGIVCDKSTEEWVDVAASTLNTKLKHLPRASHSQDTIGHSNGISISESRIGTSTERSESGRYERLVACSPTGFRELGNTASPILISRNATENSSPMAIVSQGSLLYQSPTSSKNPFSPHCIQGKTMAEEHNEDEPSLTPHRSNITYLQNASYIPKLVNPMEGLFDIYQPAETSIPQKENEKQNVLKRIALCNQHSNNLNPIRFLETSMPMISVTTANIGVSHTEPMEPLRESKSRANRESDGGVRTAPVTYQSKPFYPVRANVITNQKNNVSLVGSSAIIEACIRQEEDGYISPMQKFRSEIDSISNVSVVSYKNMPLCYASRMSEIATDENADARTTDTRRTTRSLMTVKTLKGRSVLTADSNPQLRNRRRAMMKRV